MFSILLGSLAASHLAISQNSYCAYTRRATGRVPTVSMKNPLILLLMHHHCYSYYLTVNLYYLKLHQYQFSIICTNDDAYFYSLFVLLSYFPYKVPLRYKLLFIKKYH